MGRDPSAEQLPIVGINWQGNPETEKALGVVHYTRNFCANQGKSQHHFSPPKGFGSDQLKPVRSRIGLSVVRIKSMRPGILETAAIVANCDLIITSDTSVAHLAGGMGKTTWLLLKKVPEWRWGLEGDTTFWYPL